MPGTFVISLHYKGTALGTLPIPPSSDVRHALLTGHGWNVTGRNRGLLELDLKLDDLLEMQQNNHDELDLEYVQFNVPKVLALLNKRFARKKNW